VIPFVFATNCNAGTSLPFITSCAAASSFVQACAARLALKKLKPAAPEGNRSFTVRLTPELSAEVQKIAEARLWTFSKTLGILIEKAHHREGVEMSDDVRSGYVWSFRHDLRKQ
jgi:hypothetical protein